jgi:predicted nucleic acid-binding protein
VKEFFDSSVLIAAFWSGHTHHLPSVKLLAAASRKQSASAAHSMAEVYATMTVLPVKPVIPPEQVLLFVQEIRDRLAIVTLDGEEYFETLRESAARGLTSGKVYDALLLRCALKVKARTIYTWNLKHFQAIAPGMADRIRTP